MNTLLGIITFFALFAAIIQIYYADKANKLQTIEIRKSNQIRQIELLKHYQEIIYIEVLTDSLLKETRENLNRLYSVEVSSDKKGQSEKVKRRLQERETGYIEKYPEWLKVLYDSAYNYYYDFSVIMENLPVFHDYDQIIYRGKEVEGAILEIQGFIKNSIPEVIQQTPIR